MIEQEKKMWLKQNYERTLLSRKELTNGFNSQFKTNYTVEGITTLLYKCNIKKNKTYRSIILNQPRFCTKEVKNFIYRAVKRGMGKTECLRACQVEFEIPISRHTLNKIVYDKGLKFVTEKKTDLHPIFSLPDFISLIKKVVKDNPDSKYQDILIRDEIIEKHGKNIPLDQIRYFCIIKNLNLISLTHKQSSKKRPALDMDYETEEPLESTYF